jgi:hypothetical protein
MSDAVVAHLYLAELTHQSYNPDGATVVLRVVTNEHNKQWSTATPSGELKLAIKNPLAADLFRGNLGREFEVRITLLPEPGDPRLAEPAVERPQRTLQTCQSDERSQPVRAVVLIRCKNMSQLVRHNMQRGLPRVLDPPPLRPAPPITRRLKVPRQRHHPHRPTAPHRHDRPVHPLEVVVTDDLVQNVVSGRPASWRRLNNSSWQTNPQRPAP